MRKTHKRKSSENITSDSYCEIDYEKLAEAILKAEIKAKEITEQQARDKNDAEAKKLLHRIGLNDKFPLSVFPAVIKIMFMKKEDAPKTDNAVFALITYPMSMLMWLLGWILFLLSPCTVFLGIKEIIKCDISGIATGIVAISIGFCLFLYAGILKLSGQQLDVMEDRGKAYSTVTALIALVALVISIISLLQ